MNKPRKIRQTVALVLTALALVMGLVSLVSFGVSKRSRAPERLSSKLEERLGILDGYVEKALEGEAWMHLDGLPEDMVVYRYREDTLQCWAHQFPIRNDDLRPRTLVHRLGDSRSNLSSPLSEVGPEYSYINLGPKWFLVKSVENASYKVICGLELVNELQAGSLNGINPRLRLDDSYTFQPLSSSGDPVVLDGRPIFKLVSETVADRGAIHSTWLWAAVVLLLAAGLLLLSARENAFLPVLLVQTAVIVFLFHYGRFFPRDLQLFSPLLYADGPFRYSLGAVVLVNLLITLVVADVFLVRMSVRRRLMAAPRWAGAAASALALLLCVAIGLYFHLSLRSILVNSNICLELYKVRLLGPFTAVVYFSFMALALCIPMLLQLVSPLVRRSIGLRYNFSSVGLRLAYSLLIGVYFVAVTSILGFRKEQLRVEVWANRLAMDRDIPLEIQLRSVEATIAQDPMVAALSGADGSESLIRGRLVSNYMGRIAQDYDISVVRSADRALSDRLFTERVRGGVRLGDDSHFFYSSLGGGRVSYVGLFSYYSPENGPGSLLVVVESKHNREDRGYLSLLGIADPGRVSLPAVYSWAKYRQGRLVQYKGAYAYPTVLSGRLGSRQQGHVDLEGWCHFIHSMSEDEVVIVSRISTGIIYYGVEAILLSLLTFLLLSLVTGRRRRGRERKYFQTRIALVVYTSLILTLVAMAAFSVWFVYQRNNADLQSTMTARINTLQTMLQERLRMVAPDQLQTAEVLRSTENVGNNLKCDITLFSTDGRVALSTTPEVYDRMILGHRINETAYDQIVNFHKRYYMHPERTGRRRFYALYAPLFNSAGQMIAIVSSPYTELAHDLVSEAVSHIATVLSVFLLLLLTARFISGKVVRRIFMPLSRLSRKMEVSDVAQLEPLEYGQDDELTPLVQAYNYMVQALGESSRRLTRAERDKAWTDMARRVAHDLKNPLTPIKLQLQMLMRMKQSGNPAWQERFDEVAQTVLYHVDLLSDSADQFSTFAKMYDQAPERLDLDALVRQEVDLFDSRDDLSIEYYGLEGAWVDAPRPQLTRVVVNLLTNAIQAVEDNPAEKKILVSVRKSREHGFYDIVVEDNGPGVHQDNQEKIFTPDFTTKTSGSGLGLAICRRIVDHCGGSISYSRSFVLGGACFTVKYPKSK